MVKKQEEKKVFNFGSSPLMKKTEQAVVEGYERLEKQESEGTVGVRHPSTIGDSTVVPDPTVPSTSKARAFHKERKQDVLVHCPVSLHRKLKELKDLRWDEDGIRVNINDMVVDAIADWLDKQEAAMSPQL